MITLAIDASGRVAGVALMQDGELLSELTLCLGLTHSETLLPATVSLLSACNLSIEEVDLIAVAKGPGSFTGLRIAAATAKGLAMKNGIPLLGISTLSMLQENLSFLRAYSLRKRSYRKAGFYGRRRPQVSGGDSLRFRGRTGHFPVRTFSSPTALLPGFPCGEGMEGRKAGSFPSGVLTETAGGEGEGKRRFERFSDSQRRRCGEDWKNGRSPCCEELSRLIFPIRFSGEAIPIRVVEGER